jgi:hypothetical protein
MSTVFFLVTFFTFFCNFLVGNLVSGKTDHFYTTSLIEAMTASPAFIYGGTFMGIKCYIWNFNAMSFCGGSCIG